MAVSNESAGQIECQERRGADCESVPEILSLPFLSSSSSSSTASRRRTRTKTSSHVDGRIFSSVVQPSVERL